MPKTPSQLIFDALCAKLQSGGSPQGMTREELEEVTGLSRKVLEDALEALHPPGQDGQIAYQGDRVTLGFSWRGTCEARR